MSNSKRPNHPALPAARGRRADSSFEVRTATPATIRVVNRSIILNLIRTYQPISRAQLSDLTGIHRSNVSSIVEEILADGLLIEEQSSPTGRGRVPTLLSLRPGGFLAAGISIRSTHTTLLVADLSGEPKARREFRTPRMPQALMDRLREAFDEILPAKSKDRQDIHHISVSVPGLANLERGDIVWLPSLRHYSGFPLRAEIEALTGVPTSVRNDCDLGAIAEQWHSDETPQPRNFVFLEVGDVGVGAGIMMNGELCTGHDSTFAGEFGHMVIDPNGPPCDCGRRGCWELYVCDRATWERYEPNLDYTAARFDALLEAARAGEEKAVATLRETARFLSLGISNIAFALNPKTVILAGRITELWDLVREPLEAGFSSPRVKFYIRPSRRAAEDLFLEGAVSHALGRLFTRPKLG